jgi:hypothetical protein
MLDTLYLIGAFTAGLVRGCIGVTDWQIAATAVSKFEKR